MKHSLALLIVLLSTSAIARDPEPCRALVLSPEQQWNPANSDVTPALRRFYEIESLMESAFSSDETVTARTLAEEYLVLAELFPCNWNYGNAIHNANSVLGLAAIAVGHVDVATKHLLAAGATPGSPQLDTFGPSFELAREMLKHKQLAAVQTYFTNIRSFWAMDRGVVAGWIAQLKLGEVPDVSGHCRADA